MDNLCQERVDLISKKICELDLLKHGYSYANKKINPEDAFGLTTFYFYFLNSRENLFLEIIWSFDRLGKINGDVFGLLLVNKTNKKSMDFQIYSRQHAIPLTTKEQYNNKQNYKEFIDQYFAELVIALDTYLNPFITGKDWEETPFDWTGIK